MAIHFAAEPDAPREPPGERAGIFAQHSAQVYGWAYRLLGQHHDALDVVQDVFLKWTSQLPREVPRDARGWLRRVTFNHAIDVRRRRRPLLRDTALEDATRVAAPGERGAHDQELLCDDIVAALELLSQMQRDVLVAKVFDGLTFGRIAAELKLAVPTVKTHYLRAIRAVRDRLRGRWGDDEVRS